MDRVLVEFNKEDLSSAADELFLKQAGISKDGAKYDRMRKQAFEMKEQVGDRIDIKGVYAYTEDFCLDGDTLTIEGKRLLCKAFENISPETVIGVYLYALKSGDYSMEDEKVSNQVFADFWGNAYADAGRFALRNILEGKSRLSDSFGPGFYGMETDQLNVFESLIGMSAAGIEVYRDRIMLPLKSCAGIYFAVDNRYREMNTQCISCLGNKESCMMCQFYGGNR